MICLEKKTSVSSPNYTTEELRLELKEMFKNKPPSATQKSLMSRVGATNIDDAMEIIRRHEKMILDAKAKYKIDKDIDTFIKVCESVVIDGKDDVYTLELAENYRKAGQHDKAWALLNRLSTRGLEYMKGIREIQFKILKKEGKYKDALAALMAYYMYKNQWNNIFQEEMFLKDAGVIFKKLGINGDDDKIRRLTAIVANQIDRRTYDETVIANDLTVFWREYNGII